MNPRVSIVIEAYNEEQNALAPPSETLQALRRQQFPLDQVEVVLVGSAEQIECWNGLQFEFQGFGAVRLIAVDPSHSHYWELKNQGAQAASANLLAFLDCDGLPAPSWLSTLVSALESGADVSIGPSQYRSSRLNADSAWMLAMALPSWSFTLSRTSSAKTPQPGSLMGHNLGIRRELLLQHSFPTLPRSYGSSMLFFQLARAGARLSYQPEQRVAHGFTFRWWLSRMHFRRGWETYEGRLSDPSWPRIPVLESMKYVEPLLLRTGLVARDARHWFRFGRVLGLGSGRMVLLFPLALGASVAARMAEAAGMYAALLAPNTSASQARF